MTDANNSPSLRRWRPVLVGLLATGVLATQLAQAQPHHDRHDDRRGPPHAVVHVDTHHHYRAVERDRNFRRGHALPVRYRQPGYVVADWRARHLTPPPRGHHWVRAGNDYLLVAVATGVISQILLAR